MASIQSPMSFTGNLFFKPTASDLLSSSSNGVCGVSAKLRKGLMLNNELKLDMLKELSNAFNFSKKSTNNELKLEINKRFKELVERPDVKQKIETLKAEIAKSGVSDISSNKDIKGKVLKLNGELDLEYKEVLKSVGLQVVPSDLQAKEKFDASDEEVNMIIDDVVNSSDLKDKIELLKMEVAKAGDTPNVESESKIQALEVEIKQAIKDAVSSEELKEKHEKLEAEIKATKSSEGSTKDDGSKVVSLEADHSYV